MIARAVEQLSRRRFLRDGSRASLGLAALTLGGCATQTHRSATVQLVSSLEEELPKWIGEARVPGISVVVIDRGKIVWKGAFGVADARSGRRMTTATIFNCCSLTKPVFAYFVMKLSEKGVIDLDAPLTRYAPERLLPNDARIGLITARHCLSHTTGFQNWREEDGKPLTIHFTPGSQWQYSGEGYAYLASVVTRLLGRPLEDYMMAGILSPFGMSSSAYLWNQRIGSRMAWPHDKAGRPLAENKDKPTHESVARYGAAGGLLTTPTDYGKFFFQVLDPKPADSFRLMQKTRDEMLRPQVRVPVGQPPSSWALGWQIFHDQGDDFVYHGGDDAGWHTVAAGSAQNGSGYVAMSNGDNAPEVFMRIILSDPMQKFLRRLSLKP